MRVFLHSRSLSFELVPRNRAKSHCLRPLRQNGRTRTFLCTMDFPTAVQFPRGLRRFVTSRIPRGDFTVLVALEDAAGMSWKLTLLRMRTEKGRKQTIL